MDGTGWQDVALLEDGLVQVAAQAVEPQGPPWVVLEVG